MRTIAASALALLVKAGFVAGSLAVTSTAWAQNAAAGEKKAAMCLGCHNIMGYQSSFPEVHKVPKLGGQSAKYIAASLAAYKKGDRKHPTMRAVAASLSEQDMADLAAYYEGQHKANEAAAKPKEPPADVAALLKKTNCASCHGENFSKPIDASYPKLGGQYADYLYVSLKAYTMENNPTLGRNNAIMSGMAKQYKPAELKKLADYLGSLSGELETVQQSRFR